MDQECHSKVSRDSFREFGEWVTVLTGVTGVVGECNYVLDFALVMTCNAALDKLEDRRSFGQKGSRSEREWSTSRSAWSVKTSSSRMSFECSNA